MIKTNLSFIKGDTFTQGFTISNFNLEIDKIYFTVKEKTADKNYVIQKRLNEGIEKDPEVENRYTLNIDADDTNNLKTNFNYIYDIEIVSGDYKKTIIGGYLKLEDWDVTSKVNEV